MDPSSLLPNTAIFFDHTYSKAMISPSILIATTGVEMMYSGVGSITLSFRSGVFSNLWGDTAFRQQLTYGPLNLASTSIIVYRFGFRFLAYDSRLVGDTGFLQAYFLNVRPPNNINTVGAAERTETMVVTFSTPFDTSHILSTVSFLAGL